MFKKIIIWSLVNDAWHSEVSREERQVEALYPLIQTLFPGVLIDSVTNFSILMTVFVVPSVKKIFRDFSGLPADKIAADEYVEIVHPLLPCDGNEWQEKNEWRLKAEAVIQSWPLR